MTSPMELKLRSKNILRLYLSSELSGSWLMAASNLTPLSSSLLSRYVCWWMRSHWFRWDAMRLIGMKASQTRHNSNFSPEIYASFAWISSYTADLNYCSSYSSVSDYYPVISCLSSTFALPRMLKPSLSSGFLIDDRILQSSIDITFKQQSS